MAGLRPRKELQPSDLIYLADSREQLPYDFAPWKTECATLSCGDYSIKGLDHLISVERKSESDILGCIGQERERFEREMQRMLGYESRALVIESSWEAMELGLWRQKVTPQAVTGSLIGWVAQGIPVVMCNDRVTAQKWVSRFLFIAARRRWRELQAMCDGLKINPDPLTQGYPDGICETPVS